MRRVIVKHDSGSSSLLGLHMLQKIPDEGLELRSIRTPRCFEKRQTLDAFPDGTH